MDPHQPGEASSTPLTTAAFHQLIDELRALEGRLHLADVPLDDPSMLEGYKWIFSILAVGLDAYVWADPQSPPLRGHRRARTASGEATTPMPSTSTPPSTPGGPTWSPVARGDADYLSLTVYGGPSDGRYSERIVGTLNDRPLDMAEDGTFSIVLSPDPHDGAWIELEPDAVCAITRDYLSDPDPGPAGRVAHRGGRPTAHPARGRCRPGPPLPGRAAPGCVTRPRSSPSPSGTPNTVDEPYPVPSPDVRLGGR